MGGFQVAAILRLFYTSNVTEAQGHLPPPLAVPPVPPHIA
jgi:hypothetical protein